MSGGDEPARGSLRSLTGLARRLCVGWWKSLLPLAISTAILSAVIGGAVGVGDSVQRGLLDRATSRIGRLGAVVVTGRFFRDALAEELSAKVPPDEIERLVPAIVLELSAEATADASRSKGEGVVAGRRRTTATILACNNPADLGWPWPHDQLTADSVAVNSVLASRLGIDDGDSIVLRTVARSPVAPDSPLGRRDADPLSRRMTVAAVIPTDGIGGFSLSPSQVDRPLVIAPLASVAKLFRESDAANAILAVLRPEATDAAASRAAASWIDAHLRPSAVDLGIEMRKDAKGVVRVSSTSLVLPPEVDRAASAVLGPLGGVPSLVLLANAIGVEGGGSVPYSTIAGCASPSLPFGDLTTVDGSVIDPIGDDQIVIDRWLADDLARQGSPVAVGERLHLKWFAPETLHGRVDERSCDLEVAAIVEMDGAAIERSFVPDVAGVTDEASIADWDPPFPFDASRVRSSPPDDADDRYWKQYGATPKAFVSLKDAREMGAGRFGQTTAWHVRAPEDGSVDAIARSIANEVDPAIMGFAARPVLAEAIAASRGSTPFGGLFGALSAYLVAAVLMLVWLLTSLLVVARRHEIGVLSAVGWSRQRITALVWLVLGGSASLGAIAGATVGPFWTAILLAWLSRRWQGVAGGPSADTLAAAAVRPEGIAVVAIVGFLMAMLAAGMSAFRSAGQGVRALLGSGSQLHAARTAGWASGSRWVYCACLVAASGIVAFGRFFGDGIIVFFCAATLVLIAILSLVRSLILPAATRSLAGLAWSGVAESPARSFAVVTLVAVAEFLIVAVSAFAFREPEDPRDPTGPTGGYSLMVSLATPSALDLSDPNVLAAQGLDPAATSSVVDADLFPIRATDGDDASCLNLYRAKAPVIVGVGAAFRRRGGFRFTSAAGDDKRSAWDLLEGVGRTTAGGGAEAVAKGPERIPVILDDSTARYALGLTGVGSTIDVVDGGGSTRTLEVVGLLSPGILQGILIVAEERFTELYPLVSGYRMIMADCDGSPATSRRLVEAFQEMFSDNGVEVVTTLERLRVLGTVQNIYLSGFQALGVLGMVLGTAGVAATLLRSVLERRGTFALLLAIGFTPGRIRLAVLGETLLLVLPGLAIGAATGTFAVAPQLADGRAAMPLGWLVASVCLTASTAAAAGLFVAGRAIVRRPASFLRSA